MNADSQALAISVLPRVGVETVWTFLEIRRSVDAPPPPDVIDFTREMGASQAGFSWKEAQSYWYSVSWDAPEEVPVSCRLSDLKLTRERLYHRIVRIPCVRTTADILPFPKESAMEFMVQGMLGPSSNQHPCTGESWRAEAQALVRADLLAAERTPLGMIPTHLYSRDPRVRLTSYSTPKWKLSWRDGISLDPDSFSLEHDINVEIHVPWGTSAKTFYKTGLQLVEELASVGLKV